MKVGDLIIETEYKLDGEVGFIVQEDQTSNDKAYAILCPDGTVQWFGRAHIEEDCEVISG